MDKRVKQNLLVAIVGICLFAALMNLTVVIEFLKKIIGLVLPIIVGSIIALFFNVPMTSIENRLKNKFRKKKKQPSAKFFRICSFTITSIVIIFVIVLMFTLLIPELIQSSQSLYILLENRVPEWLEYLDKQNIDAQWLTSWLKKIDFKNILQNLTSGFDVLYESVANTVSSVVNGALSAAFGIVVAIHVVLVKERLHRHSYKFVYAYLPIKWADRITEFCKMFSQSFANFLSGQCLEAVILGTLMFIAFLIFRLPYASLVGVLTAFCAIIPYVGAFASCTISIFLTLLFDPSLVIRCAIVYLCVQFVENQFIYPKVVGGSVGLPPLYTLIAVMIGGKLFGILGILFFIPLMAVMIEVIKEGAAKRLQEKNIKYIS